MSRLSYAKSMDFMAKDIEHEPGGSKLEALRLRMSAAALFEQISCNKDAGFSYSRAAGHAHAIGNRMLNMNMRARALKCFEAAGSWKEFVLDLTYYGRAMIEEGIASDGNARRYYIGIGMQAIEEAMKSANERGITLSDIRRDYSMFDYQKAMKIRKEEAW